MEDIKNSFASFLTNNFVKLVYTVGLSWVSVTAITNYEGIQKSEIEAKKTNLEQAIKQGLDPVSVRCAYAQGTDQICVAYAAGRK